MVLAVHIDRWAVNAPLDSLATHLGFVNGAVQCIVLLVVQQTELQGSQCSCRDREERRTLGAERKPKKL